ncbi:MAG: type II secretion system protein M [Thioalkalispiraceae bacterium]
MKTIDKTERFALLVGALFIVAFLVYQVIFYPLHKSVSNKHQLLNEKIQTLQWMYQATTEYAQLKKNKPQTSTSYSNDSLLTIIDQTTVKLDVRSFIRRIDPEGKDRVQIWLERINFDDLVHLLNILKRNHNINVESLSINRQSEQGQVDARITVKGNS